MALFGGFSNMFFDWLSTAWFWFIILFGLFIGSLSGLAIRKKRRLIYPVLIETNLGNGKTGVTKTTAGLFKKKQVFFKLLDFGSESEFKTKDGRKILAGSLDDMHEIDGKMGFRVYRKPDDPQILIPIKKLSLDKYSQQAVYSVAPADYRDASTQIIDEAQKETLSTWEKVAPYLFFGALVVISFIIILLIVRFAQHNVDTAKDMLIEAGKVVANANSALSVANGTSP